MRRYMPGKHTASKLTVFDVYDISFVAICAGTKSLVCIQVAGITAMAGSPAPSELRTPSLISHSSCR